MSFNWQPLLPDVRRWRRRDEEDDRQGVDGEQGQEPHDGRHGRTLIKRWLHQLNLHFSSILMIIFHYYPRNTVAIVKYNFEGVLS